MKNKAYDINGYEANRDNTSIFTFLGNLSSRNHIFIRSDPDGEMGVYAFGTREPRIFNEVVADMINNGFVAHLNLPEVADCDEDAYQHYIGQIAMSEVEQLDDDIANFWSNEDGKET